MADFAAEEIPPTVSDLSVEEVPKDAKSGALLMPTLDGPVLFFIMRGEDAGESSGTTNRYVTWISQDTADFAGVGYSGGKHPDGSSPTGAFVAGSAVLVDEFQQ